MSYWEKLLSDNVGGRVRSRDFRTKALAQLDAGGVPVDELDIQRALVLAVLSVSAAIEQHSRLIEGLHTGEWSA